MNCYLLDVNPKDFLWPRAIKKKQNILKLFVNHSILQMHLLAGRGGGSLFKVGIFLKVNQRAPFVPSQAGCLF